ncbi:phosphatidate cytidylyltransferase [Metabacillus sediminilitoris]|uniref:Phosphatidate cytidylyltransferase n=1 Tax=Metabacillus sediminilitoris TaxID=2567941 RepID=A0A4S4C5W9_9BACI|nr:phosphatidate cytidylyltransferase [Metabacillus sediminilitoris]QGQ46826.1 phosphatidate cytidylyltransferase [Metabacillus sediminilitoris]THF82974.1 phosphatidate cytidylyltransferase [Metabacillus sediminilitoris]
MKQRILTAVLAAAIFLPFIIYGGLPFTIFVYLLATIALRELLKMKKISLASIPGLVSLVILWVQLIPTSYITVLDDVNFSKAEFALMALLLLLTYTVVTKNKFTFDDVGFVVIAIFYLGIGFYFLIETRNIGLELVFYALILIWVTDSGAYFVGRAMGKNKLWPEISPNKTIEGAVGGVIFAVLFSWVYHYFTGVLDNYFVVTFMTILLSVFGQIGDLVESALKRHYQVKDSGTILPGHGGILDRFDSLLFVLPLLHFLNLIF